MKKDFLLIQKKKQITKKRKMTQNEIHFQNK